MANEYLYYTERFKQVIEDHLPYLKSLNSTTIIPIDDSISNQCNRNFYLLLNKLNIPYKYHWIILRFNGYKDPTQYDGDIISLMIPSEVEINKLMNIAQTKETTIF